MPENKLQIPIFYCHTPILRRRQAGDGLGSGLLNNLWTQVRIDAPCKSSSELNDPRAHVFLSKDKWGLAYVSGKKERCMPRIWSWHTSRGLPGAPCSSGGSLTPRRRSSIAPV